MNRSSHTDPHEHAAQQLPWLVNGTLTGAAAAELHAHLAGCARCLQDYNAQLRLYTTMRAEDSLVFAAEPSFQKLMARLEASEAAGSEYFDAPETQAQPEAGDDAVATEDVPGKSAAPLRRTPAAPDRRRHRLEQRTGALRWLAAAVVIETIGLGVLAWGWRGSQPVGGGAASYTTLSAPAPHYDLGERVRVVFRPGLPIDELARLLHGVGARIIDGPSDASVYTLGFAQPSGDAASAGSESRIAALRASPDVLFAEPAPPAARGR